MYRVGAKQDFMLDKQTGRARALARISLVELPEFLVFRCVLVLHEGAGR